MGALVRQFDGVDIPIREDQYFFATAMAKANDRRWNDYVSNDRTQSFLTELSRSTGKTVDLLAESITDGPNAGRGTWVHPLLAMNFAQWCSPRFAVTVSQWVWELATVGVVDLRQNQVAPPGMFTAEQMKIVAAIAVDAALRGRQRPARATKVDPRQKEMDLGEPRETPNSRLANSKLRSIFTNELRETIREFVADAPAMSDGGRFIETADVMALANKLGGNHRAVSVFGREINKAAPFPGWIRRNTGMRTGRGFIVYLHQTPEA